MKEAVHLGEEISVICAVKAKICSILQNIGIDSKVYNKSKRVDDCGLRLTTDSKLDDTSLALIDIYVSGFGGLPVAVK